MPNENFGSNVTKSPFFKPSSSSRSSWSHQQNSLQSSQQPQSQNENVLPAQRYMVVQQATPRGRHVLSRSLVPAMDNSSTNTNNTGGNSNSNDIVGDSGELKSTLVGATSNLINAIVGCGIVGIPYAIQQSGFVAGIVLIIVSALVTEKSLRLLVSTAKHVHVATYETAMEVAFGKIGFRWIAISMFIVAYGAMVSYLMIVKETFSSVMGIQTVAMKRSLLLVLSCLVILPLSCKRDMAALSFTSRLSVLIDIGLVALIVYTAPPLTETQLLEDHTIQTLTIENTQLSQEQLPLLPTEPQAQLTFWMALWELVRTDTIHMETIFIGLGVLSFAFVCQHSAFIIAGSLHRPTVKRWSIVTMSAVMTSVILALCCGISGYIGYREHTAGNVLMNLDPSSLATKIAKLALGTSMLFVYPLDSFVTRHVCVVLLFEGRAAHEGDDTTILNRSDRRIGLTLALFTITVIPAALFENLGSVLALTGAVGASCLSYIGPGILYLGIHGNEFLELAESSFWGTSTSTTNVPISGKDSVDNIEETQIIKKLVDGTSIPNEHISLSGGGTQLATSSSSVALSAQSFFFSRVCNDTVSTFGHWCLHVCLVALKTVSWYILGMPLWCMVAKYGNHGLKTHIHDMALKSPYPIRIGDVEYKRVMIDLLPAPPPSIQQRQQQRRISENDDADNDIYNEESDDDNKRSHNLNVTFFSPSSVLKGNNGCNYGSTTATTNAQHDQNKRKEPNVTISGQKLIHNSLASVNETINQQIGKNILERQQKHQKQNQTQIKNSNKSKNVKKQSPQNDKNNVDGTNSMNFEIEPDPQENTPTWIDFSVAILYIVLGVIAMIAGIVSLFYSS